MSWLTIESDPAVFGALINDLGVRDVQVEEVFSLDAASLDALNPLYGVVFLFKYQRESNDDDGDDDDRNRNQRSGSLDFDESIWFAHQIIQNACGTQAILGILLNQPTIDLGPELAGFRDFTAHFPADLRGETMTNSDLLRSVHNSFSRAEMFHRDDDEGDAGANGEAPNHFVAYSLINGTLWELDGLQPAPINHGPLLHHDGHGTGTLGEKLSVVLAERVERYAEGEVHFNLLALTRDPLAEDASAPALTTDQRAEEMRKRESRAKEVALRRHNFAAAVLHVARSLLAGKSRDEVDALVAAGKHNMRERRRKSTG